MMNEKNHCPSLYEGSFSDPLFIEKLILLIYSIIFLIGLVGNIMTIIIIKYNAHLRTPTNFYLLNLAVSDLMMLMCNLPLEMLEIYNRQWPLSIIFCKLRNICAEFFTCSSILTIVAFTCERYFAIVHPVHLHRLSHFRRARYIIMIIWIISLGFSLPFGLLYEIEVNPSGKDLSTDTCRSCVPKKNLAKVLSCISIISSLCLFYLPMFIIGAIYLFIGKALRRVSKYEGCSSPFELSTSSYSSYSNRDTTEIHQQRSYLNSYSWVKMRARCQARRVVIKTLVAVVIAFFVCYAPLYLQRLVVAITTLKSNMNSNFLNHFMAYLYVLSGVTFYFGSVINPILYNVVSNKYRRAFRNLFCCRLKTTEKQLHKYVNQNLYPTNHLQIKYYIKKRKSSNKTNHYSSAHHQSKITRR